MSSIETGDEGSVDGTRAPTEGPVLIHVWLVDREQEGVAVQQLQKMLAEVVSAPGFVSARLLESADRGSIAAVVEMQTVEDRQRLRQRPDVRETLDHLPGAINMVLSLYHQVDSFQASSASSGDTSHD